MRDALDWFTAIGPTLAAGAAAWVAWRVGRSTEALQRQIARPMLSLTGRSNNTVAGVHFKLTLHNGGLSPATVVSCVVFGAAQNLAPNDDESAPDYWRRVLQTLDATFERMALGQLRIIVGGLLARGRVIGPQSAVILLEANLQGDPAQLRDLLRRLVVRVTCQSTVGDSIAVVNDDVEIG